MERIICESGSDGTVAAGTSSNAYSTFRAQVHQAQNCRDEGQRFGAGVEQECCARADAAACFSAARLPLARAASSRRLFTTAPFTLQTHESDPFPCLKSSEIPLWHGHVDPRHDLICIRRLLLIRCPRYAYLAFQSILGTRKDAVKMKCCLRRVTNCKHLWHGDRDFFLSITMERRAYTPNHVAVVILSPSRPPTSDRDPYWRSFMQHESFKSANVYRYLSCRASCKPIFGH